MFWIYSYLITWVVGGVLLATSLLLGTPAAGTAPVGAPGQAEVPRSAGLAWLWPACLGFGGVGLASEATGVLDSAQGQLAAAGGAALLVLVGGLLRRGA